MNKLKIGLTITLVITILLTIYLSIATITNSEVVEGYRVLGWGYIYIYFLFPTIIILFLILTIKSFLTFGLKGFIDLKWNFLLLTLCIIMFLLTGHLVRFYFLKERIVVTVENNMREPVHILKIFGRHDLIEINDLKQSQNVNVEFRGKHIDYKTINYLENRVYLEMYCNERWVNELIVGPWTVMTWDTLNIKIFEQDSIVTSISGY